MPPVSPEPRNADIPKVRTFSFARFSESHTAYRIAGEVIKYSMNIEYLRDAFAVKMNGKKWDSLTGNLKAAFEKSAAETAEVVTKFSKEELEKNKKLLEANGVKIVEIKDKEPWKAVVPEIIRKFEGDLWEKGLYQKIRDLNK